MAIVTRAEWGARPPNCSSPRPPIDGLVVHYTGMDADEQADHKNCPDRVKGIQNYHMSPSSSDPSKPWCDIAYNFLVCKHGDVFEGRGWMRKSGATGSANSHTLAICFLGDDTAGRDDLTLAGRDALGWWIRQGLRRFPGSSVKGHEDYMNTTCPGNELMAWIAAKGWQKVPQAKVRFELWAVRKNEKGEMVPFLAEKSIAAPIGGGKAQARAALFVARVAPKIARLANESRRPRVLRVEV